MATACLKKTGRELVDKIFWPHMGLATHEGGTIRLMDWEVTGTNITQTERTTGSTKHQQTNANVVQSVKKMKPTIGGQTT